MFKQRIGFGLATLISVVVAGVFAGCGEEAEDPMMGDDPVNTSTATTSAGATSSPPAATSAGTTAAATTSAPATSAPATSAPATSSVAPSATPTMMDTAPPAGDAANGQVVYNDNVCTSCHGMAGEGATGPNITGSETAGLGAWTYAQFVTAVRDAVGPDGVEFCDLMVKYPESTISDQELADLYAYLLSVPNETVQEGLCP